MPLPIRLIAVRVAVLCFFAVGIIGSLGGLAPYTCCKRALLGALIGYLVTALAVRTINTVLTQAMITDQIRKEDLGDNKD